MIDELLTKFYNGETSPAEERQLLRLLEENQSAEHQADIRLLRTLCAEMPDFQAMAAKASAPRRVNWLRRLSVAAAVAILFAAAGTFFFRPVPQPAPVAEEITIDQARETTIMALTAYNDAITRSLDKLNNL
ncbi:MAG: hypothetical protein K2K82_09720 [Muribaculaceae bacterium]|nr:hypothetical protein [Muribaculaceae bacterium]